MKIKTILFSAIIAISFAACEKCYECTGELPVFFNGVQVSSTEVTQNFCDKGFNAKAQKEAYESEGYVCKESK